MVSIHIHLSFGRDKIGYQFVQDREILFERLLNMYPVFNSLSVSWRPIKQKYALHPFGQKSEHGGEIV